MNYQQVVQDIMSNWPEQSREAAQLVIDEYGQPDELTESLLIWSDAGPWKRIIAYKAYTDHEFPAPHIDSVESFIEYNVPTEKMNKLAEFDGSVVVYLTQGEVSARCHDLEANKLALNLVDVMVKSTMTADEARTYYAYEFLGYRKGDTVPFMEALRFVPEGEPEHDERIISQQELEAAQK